MLVFELSVKVLRYDPPIKALFSYTTPREFVVWGHRLLPIFVFASVTAKQVFYVDLEAHHCKVLEHLTKKNNVRKCCIGPQPNWRLMHMGV